MTLKMITSRDNMTPRHPSEIPEFVLLTTICASKTVNVCAPYYSPVWGCKLGRSLGLCSGSQDNPLIAIVYAHGHMHCWTSHVAISRAMLRETPSNTGATK